MITTTLCIIITLPLTNPDLKHQKDLKKPDIKLEETIGDITGYYHCKGVEAGGKQYNGVASISKKGDVYVVSWTIGSGSSFTGIGVRQNNILAVGWALATERGILKGVNVYQITKDKSQDKTTTYKLSGRWATIPGPGAVQTEILTWLREMDE